jgi:hypothetical protein
VCLNARSGLHPRVVVRLVQVLYLFWLAKAPVESVYSFALDLAEALSS